MTPRTIHLSTQGFTERPALDTAVSRALLQQVAEGAEPETLRLHRPLPVLAFGPQDARAAGYGKAVAVARENGFHPVQRLAGGRAAVFHKDTMSFSWTIPDENPRPKIHARFRELAELMQTAFQRLGVDARIGEVPGEYCPGDYSVNARGERKLMGVGQRLVGKAAHIGGVIVIDGAERVLDVLVPVYEALGLSWSPSTAGSLAQEIPGISYEAVERAIIDVFAERFQLRPGTISEGSLALAETFEPDHEVPDG